jgi:hypothetical protein
MAQSLDDPLGQRLIPGSHLDGGILDNRAAWGSGQCSSRGTARTGLGCLQGRDRGCRRATRTRAVGSPRHSFTMTQRNQAFQPEAYGPEFCLFAKQGVFRTDAPAFKRDNFVVRTR